MIKLECKRVLFYSELDETSFSERLDKINCIENWEGVSDSIVLNIKSKKVSDTCMRELLSLFYRYKIEMSQLLVLVNNKNEAWIKNENAYWYKKLFKNK